MPGLAQILSRLNQGLGDRKVGDGGPLDGGILPAGALHAHCAGGHHHIVALHLQLDAAAGAHPHKGVAAQVAQLLHGDSGRGAADAGGHHAHLLPQEGAGVGGVLPVCLDMNGSLKVLGDGLAPPRVAGKDAVLAHLSGGTLDVKLDLAALFIHR